MKKPHVFIFLLKLIAPPCHLNFYILSFKYLNYFRIPSIFYELKFNSILQTYSRQHVRKIKATEAASPILCLRQCGSQLPRWPQGSSPPTTHTLHCPLPHRMGLTYINNRTSQKWPSNDHQAKLLPISHSQKRETVFIVLSQLVAQKLITNSMRSLQLMVSLVIFTGLLFWYHVTATSRYSVI